MTSPTADPGAEPFSRTVVRGWTRFWFTPADPTPLALVRICVGLVVLYMHAAYSLDLQDFFGPGAWADQAELNDFRHNMPFIPRPTDKWLDVPDTVLPQTEAERAYMLKWDNIHPRAAYAKGYYSWSLWYHVTDPAWIRVLHGVNLCIFFFLAIGFCTRVTAVLAWLAAISYIQRSFVTVFGVDTIINLALMYLMIGPSGAALSVDRLIRRYVWTRRALRAQASARKAETVPPEALHFPPPAPSVAANLALRLLQVHICFVYLASGLSKLQGSSWWTGTAIWGTMINNEFSPVHNAFYANYLKRLCQNRWMWELAMSGASLFTLLFEVGFIFLVWNRWLRFPMIVAAVFLHTGIAVFMGLTTFSLMMVSVVCSFIPAAALHRFLESVGRGPGGLRLTFAARARRQRRAASLIHAFDPWDQIALPDPTQARGDGEPVSVADATRPELWTEKGERLTGYALFARVTRALHLLWPLALLTWLPGAAALGHAWFPGEDASPVALTVGGDKGRLPGQRVPG
jgi:hypothetical protein